MADSSMAQVWREIDLRNVSANVTYPNLANLFVFSAGLDYAQVGIAGNDAFGGTITVRVHLRRVSDSKFVFFKALSLTAANRSDGGDFAVPSGKYNGVAYQVAGLAGGEDFDISFEGRYNVEV